MSTETKEKRKPAHEIRIGRVKAAIWGNKTNQGIRYGVTVTRIYKDGTTWKRTSSFDRDDLLTLRKILDEAHTWIHRQTKQATQTLPELPVPAEMSA